MTTINPITQIPESLYIGDTWFMELKYSEFPASDWGLVVYFSAPIGAISITAAANGTAHRFTVVPTTTSAYKIGEYEYQIRAEHSSDGRIFTVGEGSIELIPPKSQQGDHRHRVKKILDSIDAVLENRATSDQLAISIAGRSLSKMGIDELQRFRGWYAQQWQSLGRKRRQKAFGKSRQHSVKARF